MVPYFPEAIQNWDISVLKFIQEHIVCPVLDVFFSLVTHLGDGGIFWICVAVLFLFFKRTRKTGIMMGAALILGLIIGNGILKNVIGRVRPYDLDGALRTIDQLLVKAPSDASSPSGHTLASFECATVLMIRDRRFGIPALIIAVSVALSRLYLYIHFPTDVFAGALLGIINGILGVIIVNAVWKAIENRKKAKTLA
mgnify:CR=1 FL=1